MVSANEAGGAIGCRQPRKEVNVLGGRTGGGSDRRDQGIRSFADQWDETVRVPTSKTHHRTPNQTSGEGEDDCPSRTLGGG